MALRGPLLPHRKMGLGILRIIPREFREDPAVSVSLLFRQEIILSNSPLIDKILRKPPVILPARHAVQADQRQFYLLMPRIPVAFPFFRTEYPADQVCKTFHNMEECLLARRLIISNRRFYHMARRIQLMALLQIRPAQIWRLDCKVCIQITVLTLRPSDQIDRLIRKTLQILIRRNLQCIRYGLQPLRRVRVLEYRPFKIPVGFPCRNPEILNTMTLLHPVDPVIQDIPLVRDQHILHQMDVTVPELIMDLDLP